jgi:hypothetical protein
MAVENLVLQQGMRDTRAALDAWRDRPWPVIRDWLIGALVVALALLGAIYVIAKLVGPSNMPVQVPSYDPEPGDMAPVLYRNSLVLALHAMACVAGFMARSSIPQIAEHLTGLNKWVHENAGKFAVVFVAGATTFSLTTQAYILGGGAAIRASEIGTSPGVLLLALTPHAIPELVALFLPLAAWLIASRRGQWNQLLAATVVTVAIAVPVLLASAAVEVYVSPRILLSLTS